MGVARERHRYCNRFLTERFMFRKILVPLDSSRFAEAALAPAISIARALQAEIDLVMVHEPRPLAGAADVAWHAEQVESEDRYMTTMADQLSSYGTVPTTSVVLSGDVVQTICNRVRDGNADLIVMSSHGRTGINRAWIGSVADGLLRKAGVPVLMIRPEEPENDAPFASFRHVLVTHDGSAASAEVVRSAALMARSSGARLSLLRIVSPVQYFTAETGIPLAFPPPMEDDVSARLAAGNAERDLSEIAQQLMNDGAVEVEHYVVVARDVGQAIVDFALKFDVDLIAMSTHGRGASRLIVGSVTEKVIKLARLPMLLQVPRKKQAAQYHEDLSVAGERSITQPA